MTTKAGHTTRRGLLNVAAATALAMPAIAMPAIAQPQPRRRWRCVTSWGRNLAGPGVTAARLAQNITLMSQGELTIELFAAGEIVPALNVLDAVSNGTVEMGHTAALFWQGKMQAAPIFTTVPFGMPPIAHAAWIDHGGGQALWDALYAPFGVKPMLAGNTGPSTAGWFRKPITSLADLKGLRIRVTGLGAEIYKRLGAVPMVVAPSETFITLERGTIDAAEFLAPANDLPMGLHKVAPHLAFPGFSKPNGASEALVNLSAWNDLPEHLKAIVATAARAEHDRGLAEAEAANAAALRQLLAEGVQPMPMPADVLTEARRATDEVLKEIAARDGLSGRIVASYLAAKGEGAPWRGMQAMGRV